MSFEFCLTYSSLKQRRLNHSLWLSFLQYDRFINLSPRSLWFWYSAKKIKSPTVISTFDRKPLMVPLTPGRFFNQVNRDWMNFLFVVSREALSQQAIPLLFLLLLRKKSDWTRKVEKEGNSNHIYVIPHRDERGELRLIVFQLREPFRIIRRFLINKFAMHGLLWNKTFLGQSQNHVWLNKKN